MEIIPNVDAILLMFPKGKHQLIAYEVLSLQLDGRLAVENFYIIYFDIGINFILYTDK